MSQDSNELYLKIESNKTNENPYTDSVLIQKIIEKKNKRKSKKGELLLNYETYDNTQYHSHLLHLLSIFLVCLFYSIVLKTKSTSMIDKYYHSLCLGFISFIDYIVNRSQFNHVLEENDSIENNYKETLLEKHSIDSHQPKVRKKNNYISISFILALLSFFSEMLIFYFLKNIKYDFKYNAGVGFSLLSIEFIFIRMFYSYYDVSLDFINLLGLITIVSVTTTITLTFLNITLLSLALFISTLKFCKFYIFYILTNRQNLNLYRVILISNIFDFIIGGIFSIIFLIGDDEYISFKIFDFSMIAIATFCYYINMKYFRDYDRYGISISSIVYPSLIFFDIFINNSKISLIQFVLICIISLGVTISYLGDKIIKQPNNHTQKRKPSININSES